VQRERRGDEAAGQSAPVAARSTRTEQRVQACSARSRVRAARREPNSSTSSMCESQASGIQLPVWKLVSARATPARESPSRTIGFSSHVDRVVELDEVEARDRAIGRTANARARVAARHGELAPPDGFARFGSLREDLRRTARL
jgi:hypothetical protein